jgi:glycosyltransferase involved in cell wall biosynthesis
MPVEQNMQQPFMISVVIPLYNKQNHIYRTIKSILDQTIPEFEIVVIDDGSTDKSVEVIKGIEDSRIRVIQQDNAGVSAARNRGINEAVHRFIAFIDADDEWLPNHLETMVYLVNKYPECSVFSTNYKIIDTNGNELQPVNTRLILSSAEQDTVLTNYFEVASKTGPPIWTGSVLIRKEALMEIGGFPPGVSSGEDLLVWARLACAFNIAYTSRITAQYHFFSYSEWVLFARKQDPGDYIGKSLDELRRNCRNRLKGIDDYIMSWHRMRLINYMKLGDRKNAYAAFKMIRKHNNIRLSNYLFLFAALLPDFLRKYMLLKWAAYKTINSRN